MFICGLKNKLDSVVDSNFDINNNVINELSALKAINLC